MAVLFIAEIIPKIVGVAYSDRVSVLVAVRLTIVVRVLLPLVWVIQKASHLIKPHGPVIAAPEEEVGHLAQMSADGGSILQMEAELVQHVLKLNDVTASDIMTPRSVVHRFSSTTTLRDVADEMQELARTRQMQSPSTGPIKQDS